MNAVQAHFARYAGCYFVGALFILLQVALSLVCNAGMTAQQQAAMTGFDWLVFGAKVATQCLPVIIAFLNKSVAQAGDAPAPAATSKAIAIPT
jgi:hypothetical protein